MSNPLYTIRQAVGLMMGSGDIAMVTGTPAVAFSTTGFQCAALALEDDDYYIDWWGRFYSGTHKDITFRVTDFTQSGGAVVFSPVVTGAVDATDLFELHRDFSPEVLNNAINMAILMVETEALEDKTDETLTVAASTLEYAVPAGFYTIDQICVGDNANVFRPEAVVDERFWQIINKSGTKYIWFQDLGIDTAYPPYFGLAGNKLRLTGQSKASQLSLDASTTDINLAYLVQQAKALLHQQKITGSGDISELHDKQMQIAQAMADREKGKVFVAPRGQRV